MHSRLRPDLTALVVLVTAGCASAPTVAPAPAPPRAVLAPRVLDAGEIAAIAEILRLEDNRAFDLSRFQSWIAHPSPEVRRRAALAAGRIGDADAVPMLMAALDDNEPAVAADAAYALGLMADTSAAVVFALVSPVGAAWSANDDRAVEATRSLGSIGGPAATAALRQILERYQPGAGADLPRPRPPGAVPAAARAALLASARLPAGTAPIDAILPYVGTGDADVRWHAAYALARLRARDGIAPLIGMAHDSVHLVRETAVRGLVAPVADSARLRDRARATLIAALDDPHPHVRINAANALGTYDEADAANALAVRAETDREPQVRLAAITALGGTAAPVAAHTLAAIASYDREPYGLRAAALDALLRADQTAGLAEATRWTRAAEGSARLHGLRALLARRGPVPDTLLDRLTRDTDADVAAAAIRALAENDETPVPYAQLIRLLGRPGVAVRAAALDALAGLATPADLPILLDAYDRATRDADPAAAIAAIDALAALARTGMPVSRAFFLRFPRPPGPAVHRAVVRRFGSQVWGEPEPAQVQHVDYERIVRGLVAPAVAGRKLPTVDLVTPSGVITLELQAADAPLTVDNFLSLIADRFYPNGDGARPSTWHRVVPNFVVQDGDPTGGAGSGPGYTIRDEPSRLRYGRATVGMASRGRDTAGSQFFITHSPQPHLDGGYTVFARVIAGMEIADHALPGDLITAFVRTPNDRP